MSANLKINKTSVINEHEAEKHFLKDPNFFKSIKFISVIVNNINTKTESNKYFRRLY